MEIPERIWHLMAKSLNKEATDVELEELTILLDRDPSIQHQFELLTRIWSENGQGTDDEGNARKLILRIIDKAEQEPTGSEEVKHKKSSRRRRRLFVSTFSVLLTMAVAWWFFSGKETNAGSIAKKIPGALVVNKGSRSRFLLPDGTTVWLNAGSQLFYENDFKGSTREVRLEGEAFFDVIKDPKRPFIVRASDIDIKVLGTAFNVKSYPEDKNVETTLYRGLVNVMRRNAKENTRIQLKPNEKLVLPKEAAIEERMVSKEATAQKTIQPSFTIINIDSTKKESERFETAWLYSRLEFRGDSFEELSLKLERWYNVTIRFTDEAVKQLRFNGSFEEETVLQAFTALKAATPFNYKMNDDEIFIGSFK